MTDEFNFDDDPFEGFDEMGLDFDSEDQKKDRSPAQKITRSALEELKNKENTAVAAKRAVYDNLPTGYRAAVNKADELKTVADDIYDSALKDLEPSIKAAKKVGRKALPKAKRLLPDRLYEKLERITSEDQEGSSSNVNTDELAIADAMKTIFDAQTAQAADADSKADAEKSIDRLIDTERFKTTASQQGAIASGINRMVAFQDSIFNAYLRTSIKLQYRSYYAQRDLLEQQRAGNADIVSNLKAVVKNTGLPEAQKIQLNERYGQQMAERVIGNFQEQTSSRIDNMVERLGEGVKQRISEMATMSNDMLGALTDGMEMASDPDMGLDPLEMAGEEAASYGRQKVLNSITKFARDRAMKNDKVSTIDSQLLYLVENANRIANDKLRTSDNPLVTAIRDIVGVTRGDLESVNHNLESDATMPVQWDLLSRRTLVEIIPGFQSRQLQQLMNIANGMENDRIVFDANREAFITQSQQKGDLQKRLNDQIETSIGRDGRDIVDSIDPDGKLNNQQRAQLITALARSSLDGQAFDPSRIIKSAEIADQNRGAIKDVVTEFFGLTEDGKVGKNPTSMSRFQVAANKFNRLSTDSNIFQNLINLYNSTGNKEALRDLGILAVNDDSQKDYVDIEKKWELVFKAMNPEALAQSSMEETGRAAGKYNPMPRVSEPKSYSTPTVDTGALEAMLSAQAGNQDRLIDAIGTMDSRSHLDVLTRIAERLDDRVKVIIDGFDPDGNPGTDPGSPSDKGPSGFKSAVSKVVGDMYGRANDVTSMLLGGIRGTGTTVKGFVGSIGDRISGKYASSKQGLQDLYVKGKGSLPKIEAAVMRAGGYINQEGEVISTISELRESLSQGIPVGTLRNGEFEVSLVPEDLENIVASNGEKVKGLFGKVTGFLGNAYRTQFGFMGKGLAFFKSLPQRFMTAVDRPKDVYVKGEDSPRLLKVIMINDGYRSQANPSRIIKRPGLIDGPVIDNAGNLVLTAEDIQHGLVDVKGRPITAKGLMDFGMDLLKRGKDAVFGLGRKGLDFAKGVSKRAVGFVDGIMGRFSNSDGDTTGEGKKDLLGTVTAIYDHIRMMWPLTTEDEGLLSKVKNPSSDLKEQEEMEALNLNKLRREKRRMKEQEEDDLLDADGDGIKDGSYADIIRKRRAKKKEQANSAGKVGMAAGATGMFGKGKAKVSDAINKLFNRDKKDDDESSGIWDLAKTAGTGIMGAIAGKLGLGAAAASTAATATTGAAGAGAAAAGGGGILAALGSAAAGVGSAVAGFFGLPVLVGAAILGTVGTAGYFGYKYFRRRSKLEPLEKLRFLQYGIPVNNKDALIAIRYLEEEVNKEFVVNLKGKNKANMSMEDIFDKFADTFGLDDGGWFGSANETHLRNFSNWFRFRFVPVFMRWKSYLAMLEHNKTAKVKQTDIIDIDDELDNKLKADLVNYVQWTANDVVNAKENPYAVMDSPFADIALVDNRERIVSLSYQIKQASKQDAEVDLEEDKDMDLKDLKTKRQDKRHDRKHARMRNQSHRYAVKDRGVNLKDKAYRSNGERPFDKEAMEKAISDKHLLVPAFGRISSPFGMRNDPFGRGGRGKHGGIDIAAPEGTPVYAAADGIIIRAEYSKSYGNVIYMLHADGRTTRYAHLAAFTDAAIEGANIKAGTQIGYVGNTGNSTGPHLHFEYRDAHVEARSNKSKILNPMAFFSKENQEVAFHMGEKQRSNDRSDNRNLAYHSERASDKTIYADNSVKIRESNKVESTPSQPQPNITVAGPDISGINSKAEEIARSAEVQREETNAVLGKLASVMEEGFMGLLGTMEDSKSKSEAEKRLAAVAKENEVKQANLVVDTARSGRNRV